ncbi:MAG: cysteine desulfurase family protein [Thermoanaerobaculia bacterium]
MPREAIYADHHATTPLRPEVRAAMEPWLGAAANASSIHAAGRKARRAVEESRSEVARALGARDEEIVFTSGGTESNNLAVRGGAWASRSEDPRRTLVAVSAAEHAAVREAAASLVAENFELVELGVDANGLVHAEELARLDERVALVSLIYASNETGVVQANLGEHAELLASKNIVLHSDAVQAVGKTPVNVSTLGVDYLGLTAHKLGGPQGAGALFVRKGRRLRPLVFGGGQEKGRRPGTENVAAIVGLGAAIRIATAAIAEESARLARLVGRFEEGLTEACPEVRFHGRGASRLPTVSSVMFPGVSGETLLVALDLEGVAASSGSACSSGTTAPSRVLLSLGLAVHEVRSTIRFSFGWSTVDSDVSRLLEIVPPLVARVRRATRLGVSA